MAGLEDLAQLLVGGSDAAIAADDPYLEFKAIPDQLSQAILSANAPQYKTKDKIIGGLITGLLSGGAERLSNDYQNRASNAYRDVVLKALGKSSDDIEKPDVLSAKVFRSAKQQGDLFKIISGLKAKEKIEDYNFARSGKLEDKLLDAGIVMKDTMKDGKMIKVPVTLDGSPVDLSSLNPMLKAGLETAAKKRAELQAEQDFYGSNVDANPNSPQYKIKKEKEADLENLRKEFQATSTFKDYATTEKGYRSILNAIKDPAGTSDLELVRGAIQAIEPGMAVREGEATAVQQSGSIPDRWRGALVNTLTSGSKLTDNVRRGILRIAQRRYDEHARSYNEGYGLYRSEAQRRELPRPESVSMFGPAKTSEDLITELEAGDWVNEPDTPLTPGSIITAPDGRRIKIIE